MKKYKVSGSRVQNGVLHLALVPKRSGSGLNFEAGQYATLSFKSRGGRPTPARCFSIVSSATDTDTVQFGIRLLGDFTHSLSRLPIGADVWLQGPFGEFVVDETYDSAVVMFAAGIGITPLMSMIRTQAATQSPKSVTLLYSCRSLQTATYGKELLTLSEQYTNFDPTFIVSDGQALPATNRFVGGKLTEAQVAHVAMQQPPNATYFICGPKSYMSSVNDMLLANNVMPDRIITESFTQSKNDSSFMGFSVPKAVYALSAFALIAGIGGIAFLDLSRYVPSHTTVSQVQTTPVSNVAATTNTQSTSSTTPTSTSTPTTTRSSVYYQAPVTSQS